MLCSLPPGNYFYGCFGKFKHLQQWGLAPERNADSFQGARLSVSTSFIYGATMPRRAPPPSLKEVGNQAYPQFCSGLLRNSIMNIIHSMWALANSDDIIIKVGVGHASQSIQRVQNSHVVQLSGCDQSP